MSHTIVAVNGLSSISETFLAFRGWLHSLPVFNQILIFIGLVALTVGFCTIIYYIVKGAFVLSIELLKTSINILKTIIQSISRHIHAPKHYSKTTQRYRTDINKVYKPASQIETHRPATSKMEASRQIHCPECGQSFTPEMIQVMQEQHHVFCEYCGKSLEFVTA